MVNWLKDVWVWAYYEPQTEKKIARLILLGVCSINFCVSILIFIIALANNMIKTMGAN